MDARDLFLNQHALTHTAVVGGNKMSAAERTFSGLTDEQMRVRPREDLNSLAWLLWHIARTEDTMVNRVLAGRAQVFDDSWMKRLGISRRDFGTGMTSAEVTELTRQIDLGALREYRDAVGWRTREVVGDFKPQDWEGETTAEGGRPRRRRGGIRRPQRGAGEGLRRPAPHDGAERRGPASLVRTHGRGGHRSHRRRVRLRGLTPAQGRAVSDSIRRTARGDLVGPMNSTMLPSGSFTKT